MAGGKGGRQGRDRPGDEEKEGLLGELSYGDGAGSVGRQRRRTACAVAAMAVTACVMSVVLGCLLLSLASSTGVVRGAHGHPAEVPGHEPVLDHQEPEPTTVTTTVTRSVYPPSSTVPQYFQTSPELWAGPTADGKKAFLAQTAIFNTVGSWIPNQPLQTEIPVDGGSEGENIFRKMGYLAPYAPGPGFGVEERPLPEGSRIVQLHMLSRHGSRYPTTGTDAESFGRRIAAAAGKFKGSRKLSFLNDWKYELGYEKLVPNGRQELFQSGVLHSYMYGQLYNPDSKIIVRTTTQDRMLKSAENFLAGFFGLEWSQNATIEVIIEASNLNNSLAGYLNCPNSNSYRNKGGRNASVEWREQYLAGATHRLNDMIEGYEWTLEDSWAAQELCPYETVALGSSHFCELFTYPEWEGFEYAIDLAFSGNNAFQSPTGRAVGLGYQQELLARLRNHTLGYSGSQINTTLDSNEETFPLNQTLYFDFSHDTNIVSCLTALGLRQFAEPLDPKAHPGPHALTVSHIVPFAARLDIEVIWAPRPVKADGSGYVETGESGGETKYVRMVLNQRTLPLGKSFPECDASRVDGWCEFETFLAVQEKMTWAARFDHACFGEYEPVPYGEIKDGAPL